MSKSKKKLVRKRFRDACYKRDSYKCVCCGFYAGEARAQELLDAHHITNRNYMPNGGYVKENGISLCELCHIKAEAEDPGFEPRVLYQKIRSTFLEALRASEELDK